MYYYFKSKEDIVRSLVEDYVAELDELIDWGKQQPRTAQTRAEIVTRYLHIVANGTAVFRMLHQNQAAVSEPGLGQGARRALQGAARRDHRPARRAGSAAARPGPGRVLPDERQLLLHALPGPRGEDHAELRAALLDVALELADVKPEHQPAR